MFSVFRISGTTGLFAVLLQLLSTGQAQRGQNVGLCPCKPKDQTQDDIVNIFQKIIKTYPCSSTTTVFKLSQQLICGKTSDPWVKQIKSCMTVDVTPCLKRTTTPVPVTTTSTTPSTTGPSHITQTILSTSTSTTEPWHVAGPITSTTSSSTTVPSLITGISTNLAFSIASIWTENGVDPATENGVGGLHDNQKNSPPATAPDKTKHLPIAVMSLLAIVFILVGVVAYLLCRRRKAKQHQYEAVETISLEKGVGSS